MKLEWFTPLNSCLIIRKAYYSVTSMNYSMTIMVTTVSLGFFFDFSPIVFHKRIHLDNLYYMKLLRGDEENSRILKKALPLSAGLAISMQAMSLSITPAQTAAWRKQIFEQLSERSKREIENFRHYEQAIEQVRALGESSNPKR